MDSNEFGQKLIDELDMLIKRENAVKLNSQQALNKFDKTVKFMEKIVRKSAYHEPQKRKKYDLKIAEIFKKYPDILTIQGKGGINIGMMAARNGFEQATLVALDNKRASLQQDDEGYNIGLYATIHKLEKATLKALDNKQASVQQISTGFFKGYNIGMLSAYTRMEQPTLKALDNKEASTQQNAYGENIGMISAKQGIESAVFKAVKDKTACKQKNELNKTIFDLYKEHFGKALAY